MPSAAGEKPTSPPLHPPSDDDGSFSLDYRLKAASQLAQGLPLPPPPVLEEGASDDDDDGVGKHSYEAIVDGLSDLTKQFTSWASPAPQHSVLARAALQDAAGDDPSAKASDGAAGAPMVLAAAATSDGSANAPEAAPLESPGDSFNKTRPKSEDDSFKKAKKWIDDGRKELGKVVEKSVLGSLFESGDTVAAGPAPAAAPAADVLETDAPAPSAAPAPAPAPPPPPPPKPAKPAAPMPTMAEARASPSPPLLPAPSPLASFSHTCCSRRAARAEAHFRREACRRGRAGGGGGAGGGASASAQAERPQGRLFQGRELQLQQR